MKLAAILSLIASIIYIIFQGMHPAYYTHLYPDISVFFDRASFFWDNQSLRNLGYNEYQPGAITFFIALTPVFLIDKSVEAFKWALFFTNSIFFVLFGALLIKMHKTSGVFLMSILLVFLGPLLLFRFDFLVILLTVFSFYLWEKKRKEIAMIVLAFAVITKVYPIIFLPYLFFQSFKQGRKLEPLYLFFTFSAAFLIYLLEYTYFLQIPLNETWASYSFHNLKSVSTESVWASLVYFLHFFSGQSLPAMESAYGINAIARASVYPSIQFYNYFWVFPLGIFYLLYFVKNESARDLTVGVSSPDRYRDKSWEKIDYKFLIFILLIFLLFSKNLSNQYLAWFLFMVPLIDMKILLRKEWVINIFLIIVTTILHTFIYPLNYSGWLAVLNTGNIDLLLLWTVLISNFLLIVLGIRIGIDVYKNHK